MLFALVLCTVGLVVGFASAAYDPNNPSRRKNFDPAEANPAGNITCIGRPEIKLPATADWDPNQNTMQELCADIQYGGLRGRSQNAYCRPFWAEEEGRVNTIAQYRGPAVDTLNPPLPLRDTVAFDHEANSYAGPRLMSPRFWHYCLQRCHCKSLETTPGVRPKGIDFFSYPGNPYVFNLVAGYRVKVDVFDDWLDDDQPSRPVDLPPPHDHWIGPPRANTPSTWIDRHPELTALLHERGGELPLPYYVHEDNRVICEGPIPEHFNPPDPYRSTDFANLQEMCAIGLSGGKRDANAGAYCHRNNAFLAAAEGYQERSVFFSDEFTPRVEWTWGGPNFLWSAAIRFHCRKYCRCASVHRSKVRLQDPAIGFWALVANGQDIFQLSPNGNLDIRSRKDGASGPKFGDSGYGGFSGGISKAVLLGYSEPKLTIAPACGPDKKQFCPSTWPKDLLGTIPLAPTPGEDTNGQCVLGCSNPGDCIAQSTDECPLQKRCIVDPTSAKQTVLTTLNRVVTTYAIASCIRQHKRLNGRDLVQHEQRLADYPCACNATYVSKGCCGVGEDEHVYEEKSAFLGSLL